MKSLCCGWLIAAAGALPTLAVAQAQYPDKPLRWILSISVIGDERERSTSWSP